MIITETKLRQVAKGSLSIDDIDTPFVVIRSSIKMPFIKEVSWEYAFVYGCDTNRNEELTQSVHIDRKTALGIIEKCRMNLAHSDKNGQVYETEGNPFKKKFIGKGPTERSPKPEKETSKDNPSTKKKTAFKKEIKQKAFA
jgi:hypothetical protein